MQADPSPFHSLVPILLNFLPPIGLVAGTMLMVASRFRWRLFCESVGVIIVAISIGALISRS